MTKYTSIEEAKQDAKTCLIDDEFEEVIKICEWIINQEGGETK